MSKIFIDLDHKWVKTGEGFDLKKKNTNFSPLWFIKSLELSSLEVWHKGKGYDMAYLK